MNKTKLFISEVIAATLIFGIASWVFELVSGNPDISVWNLVLSGLMFGIVYTPISWLLRKNNKKS